MYQEDILGSQVYAQALEKAKLISADECMKIVNGLNAVLLEWDQNIFEIKGDEDIHSANERRLKELIGSEIGGKLHTGRSRNDQVATDMRLWLMGAYIELHNILVHLIRSIVRRAESELDVIFPGYTHLQRAQPVLWSHWLLSYAQFFREDLDYLKFVLKKVKVCPLGSGALAGNPFGVDREWIAQKLGFDSASANSMQSVSDRDFIVHFQQWASLCAIHCSRIAEDLIIYSTKEFNFVSLSDAYSTGSSIMPQKKNADSLELIRGKSGRILGNHFGFQVSLKGLCSTYNKDLQNDKESMFDTYDTISKLLKILAGTIMTLSLNRDKCLAALSSDMLSTDVAYYLVKKKNLPFRDAHELAGENSN